MNQLAVIQGQILENCWDSHKKFQILVMQILYHHIIRMIGNGIHVTNIFTGLGSISMFTGRWRRPRGDQMMTDKKVWMYFQSTNLFLEQQLNCIPLHPGWDWNIFELYRGSSINPQIILIIKQMINPHKVIRRVFVSKTPNACRDGGKSTTARLNKQ